MRTLYIYTIVFTLLACNLSAQNCTGVNIISSDNSNHKCKVYQTIVDGVENEVRVYFRNVYSEELSNFCCDEIVKAFEVLSAKEKVSHTVWILEEVKNRPSDIRSKMYSTLLRVNYAKSTFLLKPMINSYFTNYTEPDDSLAPQVYSLQRKMIK